MTKMCLKCGKKWPNDVLKCRDCGTDLVDRKSMFDNARITITITKPDYAELLEEAHQMHMIVSEYVQYVLRIRKKPGEKKEEVAKKEETGKTWVKEDEPAEPALRKPKKAKHKKPVLAPVLPTPAPAELVRSPEAQEVPIPETTQHRKLERILR